MLEVTAKDERGRVLFSGQRRYGKTGFDPAGKPAFVEFTIQGILEDNALQPDERRREEFRFRLRPGVRSVTAEAKISCLFTLASKPVLMNQVTKTLQLR